MKSWQHEVVAMGAAVQAALINDDRTVEDTVMTDVCPFTMGVEIVKPFGHQTTAGFFPPGIHRNTTTPVSQEQTFQTVSSGQTEVKLRVFQGESRKVADDLKLAQPVRTINRSHANHQRRFRKCDARGSPARPGQLKLLHVPLRNCPQRHWAGLS